MWFIGILLRGTFCCVHHFSCIWRILGCHDCWQWTLVAMEPSKQGITLDHYGGWLLNPSLKLLIRKSRMCTCTPCFCTKYCAARYPLMPLKIYSMFLKLSVLENVPNFLMIVRLTVLIFLKL